MTFALEQLSPISSRVFRVFFTEQPQHRSPLSIYDCLNRDNWTISVTDGDAPSPVLESVSDVTANPLPGNADAWSSDLYFDRGLEIGSLYEITASTAMRSFVGATIDAPPDNTVEAYGSVIVVRTRPERPALYRADPFDYFYKTFDGTYQLTSTNDFALHTGESALKKRIIRRAISTPGGFFHLDDYGAGIQCKRLNTPTDRARIRAQMLEQVRTEPGVAAASVSVSVSDGILYVTVKVRPTGGEPFRIAFGIQNDGQFILEE